MSIIEVNLKSASGITQTESVTQWDFGRSMKITGLDIQKDTEVHFANHGEDKAIRTVGKYENGILTVEIPDVSLTKGTDVFVFVYESSTTTGRTIRKARIPVEKRAKPTDYVDSKTADYLMCLLEEAERTITESQKIVTEATIDRQRLEAALIHTTHQGTTILTTDSANVPPLNIIPFGKSSQKTYEGNQLFDANIITNGATVENDVITITEDSADIYLAGAYSGTTSLFDLLQGEYSLASSDSNIRVSLYYVLDDTVASMDNTFDSNTLSADVSIVGVRVRSIDGTSLKGKLFTIMLNAGSTALPFEKFTGGEASPNMNYPQELNRHGASGSIVSKLLNKNLLKNIATTKTINGITFTVNDDKSVTCDGTATAQAVFAITNNFSFEAKKQYISSGCPGGGSNTTYMLSVGWFTNDYGSGGYGSPNTTKTGVFVTIVIREGTTVSNLTFKPMIRYADIEDDTYEPYTEQPFTALTPNGLPGVPLGQTIPSAIKNSPIHMSGVYWDKEEGRYYIGDTKNENGKDVQRVIEIPMSNISFKATGTYIQGSKRIDGITNNIERTGLCTHGLYVGMMYGNKKGFGLQTIGGFTYFQFGESMTIEEFNAVKDEITVWTWLDEPIITDTLEEELEQFQALVMNKGYNTLINDAGAFVKLEQVCDTQLHIEQNYTPKSEIQEMKDQIADIQAQMVNNA